MSIIVSMLLNMLVASLKGPELPIHYTSAYATVRTMGGWYSILVSKYSLTKRNPASCMPFFYRVSANIYYISVELLLLFLLLCTFQLVKFTTIRLHSLLVLLCKWYCRVSIVQKHQSHAICHAVGHTTRSCIIIIAS